MWTNAKDVWWGQVQRIKAEQMCCEYQTFQCYDYEHSAVERGSSQNKAQGLILFCSVMEMFGVFPLRSDSLCLAPLFLKGMMCDVMVISTWSSGTLQRTGLCPQTRRGCNRQWITASGPYFHHPAYFHYCFLFPSSFLISTILLSSRWDAETAENIYWRMKGREQCSDRGQWFSWNSD